MEILAVGEILMEFTELGEELFRQRFAGDTFNTAHYMNHLSKGAFKTSFFTALGNDKFSQSCLEYIRLKGIDPGKSIAFSDKQMGMFTLSTLDDGEKSYLYWRSQAAVRNLFDQTQDLTGYTLVYFSGITGAVMHNRNNLVSSLAAAKRSGCKIAFDFNHRRQLWTDEEATLFASMVIPECDFIKISDEELEWLYPNYSVKELSTTHKESEWVLTRGDKGCETWINGQLVSRHTFDVTGQPVDTSAAGDSFNAAYLTKRLQGETIDAALRYGHHVASQVVAVKGSIVKIIL